MYTAAQIDAMFPIAMGAATITTASVIIGHKAL
jgi:hypothetical protein